MRLRVLLPTRILVDRKVDKVVGEAQNGSFCLLPRHVDFVAALVPGILAYHAQDEKETFVAIDEGTLVKCGPEVFVSVQRAVIGDDLGRLRETVEREFRRLDEHQRAARDAITRLEAGIVRRFIDVQKASG